ncbi:unnamed protein product, partial [Symbiodinium necroappetens]
MSEAAEAMGWPVRLVRTRLRATVRRMVSPRFGFVAAHVEAWPRRRRAVAKVCILQGGTMREACETLGYTLHTVRTELRVIDARACEAASMMGASITRESVAHGFAWLPSDERLLDAPITLATGPSGSGKTRFLDHARSAFRSRGVPVIDPERLRPAEKPAVDLVGRDATRAMRALASVGLAELRCFVRKPSELSEGQRFRLRLAMVLDRAPKGKLGAIVIDEFGSSLDALTARSLALLLRRVSARRPNLRFVIATNREFVAPALAPNLHLALDLAGRVREEVGEPVRLGELFEHEAGTREDLMTLLPYHYRAGAPATVERVLRAVDRETGTLAGVLAVSHPTLNGVWRAEAWPGVFDGPDKAASAIRVNRDLRTISRVIVDPRFRGLGVATALVRAYLRDPLTRCTEALATMGGACPFFRVAGMAEFRVPESLRDERLGRVLREAGVEPWRLATPGLALARARRALGDERLGRELLVWAHGSRATVRLAGAPIEAVFAKAAVSVAARRVAYGAGLPPRPRDVASLRAVIADLFGVDPPGRAMIEGHHAPMDYLAHAFFQGEFGEMPRDCVVWANRGGGKTFCAAVATALDLLYKPEVEVKLIAGSREQSARMFAHLARLFRAPGLAPMVEGKITASRLVLVNGSNAEILSQSHASVRGMRPQIVRCDEVELFDPEVWEAIQFAPRSKRCGDVLVKGSIEALSTWHVPLGVMSTLVGSCRGDEPVRTLFRWGVLDVLEKCAPQRACGACPLHPECEGRAKDNPGGGHVFIDDAVAIKSRSCRESWEAEMLSLRPSRRDAVYPEFDPDRHVREPAYELRADGGARFVAGMDFGFRSPAVVLWAHLDPLGVVHVLHEHAQEEMTLERHLREMRRPCYPRVSWIGVDPAGAQRNDQTGLSPIRLLKDAGYVVRARRSRIEDGVRAIRQRLDPAAGEPTLFIHPRCAELIRALTSYRFPSDNPRATNPVKDGADHAADALRYLVTNIGTRRGAKIIDPCTIESDWARLGILFNCAPSVETPDLERLLLETARRLSGNARLLPLVVTWLGLYGSFVARHRLRRLVWAELEPEHRPALGLILESAIQRGATKDLRIAIDVCERAGTPGPLHDVHSASEALRGVAERNASELSRKWGLWTPEFDPKLDAVRPVSWLLEQNPEYQRRIVRKGDLRASILETLIRDGEGGVLSSEAEVARRCGASRRATKQALEALELEGEIETTDGRPGRNGCPVRVHRDREADHAADDLDGHHGDVLPVLLEGAEADGLVGHGDAQRHRDEREPPVLLDVDGVDEGRPGEEGGAHAALPSAVRRRRMGTGGDQRQSTMAIMLSIPAIAQDGVLEVGLVDPVHGEGRRAHAGLEEEPPAVFFLVHDVDAADEDPAHEEQKHAGGDEHAPLGFSGDDVAETGEEEGEDREVGAQLAPAGVGDGLVFGVGAHGRTVAGSVPPIGTGRDARASARVNRPGDRVGAAGRVPRSGDAPKVKAMEIQTIDPAELELYPFTGGVSAPVLDADPGDEDDEDFEFDDWDDDESEDDDFDEPSVAKDAASGPDNQSDSGKARTAKPFKSPTVIDQRSGIDRRDLQKDKASGFERRRGPGRRRSDFMKAAEEGEMSREQFQFLLAIDTFKKSNNKTFPTWTDILEIVRLLGYRKTAPMEVNLPNAEVLFREDGLDRALVDAEPAVDA